MAKKAHKTPIEIAILLLYEGRKARVVHPTGTFDSADRWYPTAEENVDDFTCFIRSPSRSWPNSYMLAARTQKHIKALAEIDSGYVVKAAREVVERSAWAKFAPFRERHGELIAAFRAADVEPRVQAVAHQEVAVAA
jgi:hypothetical protein